MRKGKRNDSTKIKVHQARFMIKVLTTTKISIKYDIAVQKIDISSSINQYSAAPEQGGRSAQECQNIKKASNKIWKQ